MPKRRKYSAEFKREAVAEGIGWSENGHRRENRLAFVLENFESEPLPVSIVYPGGRLVSARLRGLINRLKEVLRVSDAFD